MCDAEGSQEAKGGWKWAVFLLLCCYDRGCRVVGFMSLMQQHRRALSSTCCFSADWRGNEQHSRIFHIMARSATAAEQFSCLLVCESHTTDTPC